MLITLRNARRRRQSELAHDDVCKSAARFWARIFAMNFAMGVVTGIPMEFQFGANWEAFSRTAGGVIGQTLAMEGVFSLFLESSFLGLFLYGEERPGPTLHIVSAVLVFLGSWLQRGANSFAKTPGASGERPSKRR